MIKKVKLVASLERAVIEKSEGMPLVGHRVDTYVVHTDRPQQINDTIWNASFGGVTIPPIDTVQNDSTGTKPEYKLTAKECNYHPGSSVIYDVVCTWTKLPSEDVPTWSLQTIPYDEPIEKDLDDKVCENSAKQKIEPEIIARYYDREYTATMTRKSDDVILQLAGWVGSCNNATISFPGLEEEFAGGTLLFSNLAGEQIGGAWHIQMTFTQRQSSVTNPPVSQNSHKVKYADRGFAELTTTTVNGNTINKLHLMRDTDGENFKTMQFLDGKGKKLKDGEKPYILTFRVNEYRNFQAIANFMKATP